MILTTDIVFTIVCYYATSISKVAWMFIKFVLQLEIPHLASEILEAPLYAIHRRHKDYPFFRQIEWVEIIHSFIISFIIPVLPAILYCIIRGTDVDEKIHVGMKRHSYINVCQWSHISIY